MKTSNRIRIQGLGLIGAFVAILAGIPDAEGQPLDGRILDSVQKPDLVYGMPTSLRRIVAALSSPSASPAGTDRLAHERAQRQANMLDTEARLGQKSIIASLATQVAYASSGAGLFAAGIIAKRALPVALGSTLTARPQPWPAGIHISGSFHLP